MEIRLCSDAMMPIGVYITLPSRYNSVPYYYKTIDPIVDLLTYLHVPVGSYSLSRLTLDIPSNDGVNLTVDKENVSYLSRDFIAEYVGAAGKYRYLLEALEGSATRVIPPRERSILHKSSHGTLLPVESFLHVPMGTVSYGTPFFPTFDYPQLDMSYYSMSFEISKELNTLKYNPIFNYDTLLRPPHKVDITLKRMSELSDSNAWEGSLRYNGGYYDGWYSFCKVMNFQWSGNPVDGYVISYDFRYHFDVSSSTVVNNPRYGWDFSNTIKIDRYEIKHSNSAMPPGSSRSIASPYGLRCELACTTTGIFHTSYAGYSPSIGQTDTYVMESEQAFSIGFPTRSSSSSSDILRVYRSKIGYDTFMDLCSSYQDDFRGAAFFSGSDAIDSLLSSVGTNLLQSLPKLSGFMDVLPDVAKILVALGQLKSDPVQSIGDLTRILSGDYLKTIFGTRSNYELATKYVPKILDVIDYLSKDPSRRPLQGRGSYKFKLPSPFPDETYLQVRSKLVISDVPSEPLRSILGLNSLGILPTPQRMWDLVPMSFVVNWITNLGSLIKSIQNVVLGQLLSLEYGVHSYTVIRKLDSSVLESAGMAPDGLIDPTFKYYRREVSHVMPTPLLSRLEFYKPQGLPNWLTPLALIVQRT